MCSTSLLYKILPTTNLVTSKPAIYTFIHHIKTVLWSGVFTYFRRNSVFHNFAGKIVLIWWWSIIRKSKHVLPLQNKSQNWPPQYKTFSWRRFFNVGTGQSEQCAPMGFQRKRWKISKMTYTAIRFLYSWQAPNLQCELALFERHNVEFMILILHSIILLCVIECNL